MKLSIEQPLLDSRVSIDASVAQKRPMRPMFVHAIPFHVGNHDLFSIYRTFGNDFATRRRNKALSPKLDSVAARRRFVPDAIRGCDITTIRNGVAALDRLPGRILGGAEFLFFRWMPTDGGWIK